jgi:hypothetical protein
MTMTGTFLKLSFAVGVALGFVLGAVVGFLVGWIAYAAYLAA